jgi:glycosyltransferase involved in cell wall biosynthesis
MIAGPPLASVVVSTHERLHLLNQCLSSVRQLRYPRYEVIVVESASAGADVVADRYCARYVAEPKPGLSRARNVGARHARGDIVAFLDDDTTVDPLWLGAIVNEFADSSVMAVGGQVLPKTGGTDAWSFRRSERRVVAHTDKDWFEVTNFGGVGNGPNIAVRRSAFDVWPGFDERLGTGCALSGSDEHNAFFRLVQRGYRVVSTPHAIVYHAAPSGTSAKRHVQAVRDGAAYLLLLMIEERGYRLRALRYGMEALLGKRRSWRPVMDAGPALGMLTRLTAIMRASAVAVRTAARRA